MNYYVAKDGNNNNNGSYEAPFSTIQRAADIAQPGDIVTVCEGIYREWVNPKFSGLSRFQRIIYKADKNKRVVIKGSEKIDKWEKVSQSVWKTSINNNVFGNFNPFNELVKGDWVTTTTNAHLGEIYLNGAALFEVQNLKQVESPIQRKTVENFFTHEKNNNRNFENEKYVWFADVLDESTIIYANFQEVDPNSELVEFNCRPCAFFPKQTGMSYITVQGFEIAQVATQWAPPTGIQQGAIGPHWSKGWIIKDNVIHDSKCCGISLGKNVASGNNNYTYRLDKPGYNYQLETVFAAEESDWNKEHIGSHLVSHNHIYNCGQAGIVGHLGAVYSKIIDNHIHDIAVRHEFGGWEMAGIKLHAAIDVQLKHNYIHNCSLGTWLDWQAQGTIVQQSIYYDNGLDLFVEVSHGPYTIDHNILGSKYSLRNFSQGGAYVNNLFAGDINVHNVLDRATPYHIEHSTKIKGVSYIYGGDDRYYNNIFIGGNDIEHAGTYMYDGSPQSLEEYIANVYDLWPLDHEAFYKIKQPIYIDGNIYLNGAKRFSNESNFLFSDSWDPDFKITCKDKSVFLNIKLPDEFAGKLVPIKDTKTLPKNRVVGAEYERADGMDLFLDTDLLSDTSNKDTVSGPIQKLHAGNNHIKIR